MKVGFLIKHRAIKDPGFRQRAQDGKKTSVRKCRISVMYMSKEVDREVSTCSNEFLYLKLLHQAFGRKLDH